MATINKNTTGVCVYVAGGSYLWRWDVNFVACYAYLPGTRYYSAVYATRLYVTPFKKKKKKVVPPLAVGSLVLTSTPVLTRSARAVQLLPLNFGWVPLRYLITPPDARYPRSKSMSWPKPSWATGKPQNRRTGTIQVWVGIPISLLGWRATYDFAQDRHRFSAACFLENGKKGGC